MLYKTTDIFRRISCHGFRIGRLCLAVCCCAVLSAPVLAPAFGDQPEETLQTMAELPLLWRFAPADGSWPAPPEGTIQRYPIRLDADIRHSLSSGAVLLVEVDEPHAPRQLPVHIIEEMPLINGDRSFSAELLDGTSRLPLILTLGSRAVFAYLESDGVVWQLNALQANDGSAFKGWVYESRPLDGRLQNDYVIPQRPDNTLAPPARKVLQQPLLLAPSASAVSKAEAGNTGIHDGNLRITQQAPTGVLAGSPVTVSVNFSNISQENHRNLVADLYFVLENSTLLGASAGCAASTVSGQLVLRCALGNIGAGASHSISYTVQTSTESRPYLTSTAIIGAARQDTFINVVEDVASDSDGDGISDFNERLMGSDPQDSGSVDRSKTMVDVMALYTADAQSLYGGHAETRINQLISVANQIYADSGADIILRPVFHQLVDYPQQHDMDTMLDNLTFSRAPFTQVPSLREAYGADLVILFRPHRGENDRCGLANLGGNGTLGDFSSAEEREYAYSLVAIDCPVSSVVAHEVGHNMGLTHSHREDGAGGTFPYATGFGVDRRFTTVMAYPGAFNTGTRIARFSSPLLDCDGSPCGIDHRDEQGADAVRALNLVRQQLGGYYATRVPDLPVRLVASSSGGQTNARIASAASTNAGLSYVQRVSPGQMLDITATLQIDTRHVGRHGVFHVLVGLASGEYFLYTEQGLSRQQWDGTINGLQSFFGDSSPLRTIEYLRLLTRLQIDQALAGNQVHIHIAYRVLDTGELIFTPEPLVIDIVR